MSRFEHFRKQLAVGETDEALRQKNKVPLLAHQQPEVDVLGADQLFAESAGAIERITPHHDRARRDRPDAREHLVHRGRVREVGPDLRAPDLLAAVVDDDHVGVEQRRGGIGPHRADGELEFLREPFVVVID